ncbi:hypothetical protein, partial [Neisseria gonorrhoeae]|uniref:hypothetical protein n=2 Tax=Neisseria gonorrhoeae TaxID=485 RepID=UPI002804043C
REGPEGGLLFFLLFLHLPKIPGRRLKQTHRKPSEQIKPKISKNPNPIKRLKLRTNKNRNHKPINKQQVTQKNTPTGHFRGQIKTAFVQGGCKKAFHLTKGFLPPAYRVQRLSDTVGVSMPVWA